MVYSRRNRLLTALGMRAWRVYDNGIHVQYALWKKIHDTMFFTRHVHLWRKINVKFIKDFWNILLLIIYFKFRSKSRLIFHDDFMP